ncbi:hypothetical protein N8J89_12570 [Crossiella sp. CA-258035]|uniref:hypothetical protein n=1 Tax=Crossiella sp. CA-258035 TaxID=2981138 RepID=UPI0024BD0751|nr:hypothetical protein [Crossiella sp. CA-258035]WHT21854.1 hypothetical protein N8J89_12570 [Crossiella sp. CA-258035]
MTDQPRPRRVEVDHSGPATASAGGFANTGVHIGDVNLLTGIPVRTNYRHQVQRIAPPELVDRDRELAELAAFCTSPETEGAYRWWQAGAWSGKTALLSWFVLNPPPGVRLVSFFITARLAGQNNRSAFIDNLLEQLLALLGETVPPFLTEATREPHLLGLLDTAAQLCRDRGEHLVLLVDGLDEDRGVTTGPDAHSIAALLPADPPAGMRVIVAGRPNPPVPADVPPHHPLRACEVVRALNPSPAARAMRHEMERDLHGLLRGTQLEQDLLGLITAAGGGLTGDDLAELAGCSAWEVGHHLTTVTGRSFARRDSYYHPGAAPEVFLLGHEELQLTAQDMLGPTRLTTYRDRLHTWADTYRDQRWPPGTPEYLVRGYHTMLTATGDLPRLTALATDPARQERLHDYSGGDSAALAEIVSVLAAQVEQDPPDLTAITRLAIHRDHLNDRHNDIPVDLPAACAMVGQVHRAEALLRFLTSSDCVDGRISLAEVLLARGDRARAANLLEEATALARASRFSALLSVWAAFTRIGDEHRAAALMAEIEDRVSAADRPWRLVDIAAARSRCGEVAQVAEIIADAEPEVRAVADPADRATLLIELAEIRARTGDLDGGRRLAEETGALLPSLPEDEQDERRKNLAGVLARCGDTRQAATVAADIPDPHQRDGALCEIAVALAREHDLLGSRAAILGITDPATRAEALARVAPVLADCISEAIALANTIEESYDRSVAQAQITKALVRLDDLDRAEDIARAIEDSGINAAALVSVALARARRGTVDQAFALTNEAYTRIRTRGDRFRQAETLLATANACLKAGNNARAAALVRKAEPLARGGDDGVGRGFLLCQLAAALLEAGEFDEARAFAARVPADWRDVAATSLVDSLVEAGDLPRAEEIARTIPTQRARYWCLLDIADAHLAPSAAELIDEVDSTADREEDESAEELLARMGDSMARHEGPRAAELAERAVTVARTLTVHRVRVNALTSAALGQARLGDQRRSRALLAEAERTAGDTPPSDSFRAWAEIVTGYATVGEFDRAEALVQEMLDYIYQNQALAACVQLLVEHGDPRRAEHLVQGMTTPDARVRSMLLLAGAQSHPDRRDRLVQEAELAACRAEHLIAIAGFLLDHHAPERAAPLIARAIQEHQLDVSVGELARVLPSAVDVIEAELDVVRGD